MNKIERQIIETVDNRKEDFIGFFQKLIQIPSFTKQEQEVADELLKGMQARGFQNIEVVERIPGRPNVLAHINGSEDGPTYTFNGHMDVLPPQDNNEWPHPPFGGHIEDGRIYGRGTVDMKSGTFSSFFAGLVINDLQIPLKGNVLFTAVCDELICGKDGILHLIKDGYVKMNRKDDFGINCEPTDLLEMNMATKGVLRADIKVKGKGAFSARPYQGISAINKSIKLMKEIMKLDEKIRNDQSLRHPLLEPASVMVTLIKGGEASNLVPDTCTLTVTRRMLPCETMEGCLHDYEQIIEKLHIEDPEFNAEIHPWENFRPSVELPLDIPLVDAFKRAQKLITGKDLMLTGSEGGTDASLVVYHTGIPMPVYGPGNYNLLGTVNEHVTKEDFLNAIKIYALSIYYMLGIDD
jgi:acetylornithine deacetylase/succinyl-diaminopimelate desuccinylase family protein